MEEKIAEDMQQPSNLTDATADEPEGSIEVQALKAENDRLWQAVESYAPQIVDILAEHGDTELLASVAQRLSSKRNDHRPSPAANRSADDPIQQLANEAAKQFVDFLFASQAVPSSEPRPEDTAKEHREAGRLEEYTRQKAVRRSTVERGSAERREPGITLDAKSKEIAQAFGLSEEKLAQVALERLQRKGVVRP